MTDHDDLRAAMLAVLTEHYPNPVWCKCGWRASLSLNDTQSDRQQTLGHVAALLAEHPAPEPPGVTFRPLTAAELAEVLWDLAAMGGGHRRREVTAAAILARYDVRRKP